VADLTTLANVKQWLQIPTAVTTNDALLSELISAASEYIQTFLNRTIASQTYSEARDGKSQDVMMFANYPVSAVSSVQVGSTAIPPSPDGIQPGFVFDQTRLILVGDKYCFDRGRMNCRFSYTAGFATTPKEIERVCEEMVGLRFKNKDRIGVTSKTLANEVVTFTQADVTDSAEQVLSNYKKVIPV
jgi:hypothetical protein